jgi:hypothetical protein
MRKLLVIALGGLAVVGASSVFAAQEKTNRTPEASEQRQAAKQRQQRTTNDSPPMRKTRCATCRIIMAI